MTTSRLNFTEPKHTKAAGGLLPLANFSTNLPGLAPFGGLPSAEIGRGAGWGRGENSGGARSLKKKKEQKERESRREEQERKRRESECTERQNVRALILRRRNEAEMLRLVDVHDRVVCMASCIVS